MFEYSFDFFTRDHRHAPFNTEQGIHQAEPDEEPKDQLCNKGDTKI